jgi:hypothetical protein
MTNTGARIGLRRKRCGRGPERTRIASFGYRRMRGGSAPKGELARGRGFDPGLSPAAPKARFRIAWQGVGLCLIKN